MRAQNHVWSFTLGDTDTDGSHAVAVDAFGHVYWAAHLFNAAVDLDPGPNVVQDTVTNSLLACYDVDRNYRWSWDFAGGTWTDMHLATDSHGSVVVAGFLSWSTDLDPGPAIVDPFASGNGRLVVAKYDSTGAYLWSFNIGSAGTNEISGLALDSLDNVYISGISDAGCDFDPGPGTNVPYTTTTTDHNFLAKYDADGNHLWARTFDGPAYTNAPALTVDAVGNAYLSGTVYDSLNVDPGVSDHMLHEYPPVEDVFLARYHPDGSFDWAGTIAGALDGYDFAAACNRERVAIAGTFRGTYDFDMGIGTSNLSATVAGAYDAYVASYDSLGQLQWARRYGMNGLDKATCLDMNAQGDVTFAGYFSGLITLIGVQSGSGWDDVFVGRANSNGDLMAGFVVGSSDYDRPDGLDVAPDGSTYVAGNFSATIDLDPQSGVAAYTPAGYDAFLARYDGLSTAVDATEPLIGSLAVYPDPVSTVLHVQVPGTETFQLFDAHGRCLRMGRWAPGANQVDLTDLSPGVYLLHTAHACVRVVKE